MFALKKINDEVVREVPIQKLDLRPVKGAALFPVLDANIFLCARKKSGKTSAVFKILKRCAGPRTKIMVFCSTVHKDESWNTIRLWAQQRCIPFVAYTSLIDDNGNNLLADLIEGLQKEKDEKEGKEGKEVDLLLEEPDEPEEEVTRSKYRTPEWIFVFDDLADELRKPIVATFLRKNRHFLAKTIISSQYINDIYPAARKQLDYVILFKGHQQKKIDEIGKDVDIGVPKDELWDLYKFATEEPYSFLYCDVRGGTFRRNFNELIEIQE